MAKNSRQKCYESVRFIGRIRSSWNRITYKYWNEIDAVLFVEPTVEIGWDRIFLLF